MGVYEGITLSVVAVFCVCFACCCSQPNIMESDDAFTDLVVREVRKIVAARVILERALVEKQLEQFLGLAHIMYWDSVVNGMEPMLAAKNTFQAILARDG